LSINESSKKIVEKKNKNKQIHSSKKVKSKNKSSQIRKGKGSFKKERKKDQYSLVNKEMMYKNYEQKLIRQWKALS